MKLQRSKQCTDKLLKPILLIITFDVSLKFLNWFGIWCRLPKDGLPLAIVEPKPLSMGSMISEKEDFFIHTPRKTISEVLETRNVWLLNPTPVYCWFLIFINFLFTKLMYIGRESYCYVYNCCHWWGHGLVLFEL